MDQEVRFRSYSLASTRFIRASKVQLAAVAPARLIAIPLNGTSTARSPTSRWAARTDWKKPPASPLTQRFV